MSPVKIKGKFKKQINLESLRDQEHQYPTMTALLYPSKTIVTPPSPTLAPKTTHDDPSELMKKIEGFLVTGAALAKQLEETSRTKELVPHDGDVVYIFGGMPFRYMDHHNPLIATTHENDASTATSTTIVLDGEQCCNMVLAA
jgi:hypothetical protein